MTDIDRMVEGLVRAGEDGVYWTEILEDIEIPLSGELSLAIDKHLGQYIMTIAAADPRDRSMIYQDLLAPELGDDTEDMNNFMDRFRGMSPIGQIEELKKIIDRCVQANVIHAELWEDFDSENRHRQNGLFRSIILALNEDQRQLLLRYLLDHEHVLLTDEELTTLTG